MNANDSIDTALLYIYERRLRALLLRMDAEVHAGRDCQQ